MNWYRPLTICPGGKRKLLPQIPYRARPGTPTPSSGLLQARAGVPGRALLLTELICIEVEDA